MAKLVTYDAAVIQEFASRLYRRANSIIVSYSVIGTVIGIAFGVMIIKSMQSSGGEGGMGFIIFFCGDFLQRLVFAMGQERAFKLKLEAQVALCQVQIEKNTASTK